MCSDVPFCHVQLADDCAYVFTHVASSTVGARALEVIVGDAHDVEPAFGTGNAAAASVGVDDNCTRSEEELMTRMLA